MSKIDLYHGTTPNNVKQLQNCKINVGLGGGEFGKGFYLGSSKRLAKRRAFHKSNGHFGIANQAMNYQNNTLMVTIDTAQLAKHYKEERYSRSQSRTLFKQLRNQKQTASFSVHPKDYMVGYVAGRRGRYLDVIQYKFDSQSSVNVLNKQCTNVTSINTQVV